MTSDYQTKAAKEFMHLAKSPKHLLTFIHETMYGYGHFNIPHEQMFFAHVIDVFVLPWMNASSEESAVERLSTSIDEIGTLSGGYDGFMACLQQAIKGISLECTYSDYDDKEMRGYQDVIAALFILAGAIVKEEKAAA